MRRVTGATKYFDFKELEAGAELVDGWYVGEIEGKFGIQHEFKEEDGTLVVIGGGHLNWLVNKYLSEGDRCKVFFEGMDILTKGRFSGKEVKKFSLEIEDDAPVAPKPKPMAKSKKVNDEESAPWEGKESAPAAASSVEDEDESFGADL